MRLWSAFVSLWLTWFALGNADEPVIICFYRGWTVYYVGYERLEISNIDSSLCTHLIYAYVAITEDCEVRVLRPKVDLPDGGGKAGFQKFNALRKKNERLKTLVATGELASGSVKYAKVAADSSLRAKYVKNVVDFVLRHEFDGFDINWEWLTDRGGPNDVKYYPLLLKELRESFDQYNLTLTIRVEGSERYAESYYDIPEISKYPHFILLLIRCHDSTDPITGHNTPLLPATREISGLQRSLNIEASLSYWLEKGVPAKKIILGTRFWGLGYTLNNSAEHAPGSPASGPIRFSLDLGTISYNEICRVTSQDSWTTVWDEEQRVPYSYGGNRWISYDNVRSLTEKGKYAKAMGLGGVMVWTIDMDDHRGECGRRYPLLKALNCGLRDIGCNASTPAEDAGGNFATTSKYDMAENPDSYVKRTCATFALKYVRDPEDCAKFWICQKIRENEFRAEPFSCGVGLYFDTKNIICESKNVVHCG